MAFYLLLFDFLAATRRLSQRHWLCLMLDGFMLLILSASPSTALTLLLNSSEIYPFAKNTSIFGFYLMNPSPFSLGNYSLFLRGGGRKGFLLETQLASATQRNNKGSATDSKSLKPVYTLTERNKKHAHYQFQNIHGLGKVTHCHHHRNH